MSPLREHSREKIRPCPPLAPSPAGFLAHARMAASKRHGLLWAPRPGTSRPSTLTIDPEAISQLDFYRDITAIPGLVSAISRLLTQGETSRARQGGFGEDVLRSTLQSLGKHSWDLESYLDGVPKSEVSRVIATSGLSPPPPDDNTSETDDFVLALATWFKLTYMRWVDPIPCPTCNGATQAIGSADPTPAERAEGGGRAELHQCTKPGCGAVRRFVRYGSIGALMRTREGRCGEWAHLFYAFLRVTGVEARYIWNSEDHVWAEYWSPKKQHWVHVDPCEAAVDKPLLYDKGWGKKQTYCLALGPRGAEDVTAVYVVDHADCLTRRHTKGWRERTLALALEQHTISLQLQHPSSELEQWDYMIEKQNEWKCDIKRRMTEAQEEELGGRESGPEEWRKMRDELGGETIARPVFTAHRELHNLKSSDVWLFGDATRSGSGVILTTQSSQTSGVFADIRLIQTQSFRTTVTFRMTSPPGAGEADGIAIVFAKDRKLGMGGYGLGYSGLGGAGDFAVEVDTYRTQDHADDPPAPHISVHSPPDAHHRHSIACTKAGQIPFLSAGRVWALELIYDGASRRLMGWLRNEGESNSEIPERKIQEAGLWAVTLPAGDGEDWYVGVTASCGGLWQKQEVLEWQIEAIVLG